MAFTYKTNAAKSNVTNINGSNAQTEREPSEFDGIYVNVGIPMEIDCEEVFARLPHRAIALADLELYNVTDRTRKNNPRWAAQADQINGVVAAMRKGGLGLEEGEGAPLKLALQIFRAEPKSDSEPVAAVSVDVADIMG